MVPLPSSDGRVVHALVTTGLGGRIVRSLGATDTVLFAAALRSSVNGQSGTVTTDRRRDVTSVAVGSLATVGSLSLVVRPWLALVTGVSFGVVAWLTLAHPDTVWESDRPGSPVGVGRWSGALVGFVAFVVAASSFGVRGRPRVTAAVGLAVVGVCYASWLLGVAYARGKAGR